MGLVVGEVWGQATFVSARHETISQREVDVNFNAGVSFSGAPTSVGWSVTVNGVGVPITSIGTFGPNTIRIQFNASTAAGHAATEPFLKPGEILRVTYAGGGNLNAPGITPFANQQSQNNFVFNCGEMIFFKQEAYASVDVCSPVVMNFTQFVYKISLRYRNSSTFNLAQIFYAITWGDATNTNSSPYISDVSGVANPTFIDNTGFTGSNPAIILTSRPSHNYPAPNPGDCSFNFSLTPFVNGVAACPSITNTTLFATYDTDNANSGVLNMPPSVVGSNLVCKGDNANMMFTDATSLNCRAAIEPIVPNEQARHLRIVYGNRNYDSPSIPGAVNNIPDVRVGGVPVTNNDANGTRIFPAGYFPVGAGGIGVPDFNGVIQLATPVTVATATAFMQNITTTDPTLQQVDQRFYVQLQYWDICNPYNAGNPASPAPVTIENFVQIIDSPNPPAVNNPIVCETTGTGSFNITATGVGAGALTYTWYKDAALSIVLQATSADNTFNPVTEGPAIHRINPTVAASTIFTRYVTVTQGSNNCTSQPQTITIQIDDTNTSGTIAHPLGGTPITICSGDDPVAFTSSVAGTGGGPGGAFTYQWQNSTAIGGPYNNIVGANAATFDPTPAQITSGRFFRRQVISGQCATVSSNVIEFRVDAPVTGGSIAGNQTICAAPGDPANLTSSAGATGGAFSGVYNYQWEESTVSALGPFNTIVGATSTTYNPPPGVVTTTFYRRRVNSGICVGTNVAYSNVITVTVDQVVVPGVVNNPQTICSGQDPAILGETTPPSGGNGSTYTFQWQESATGGGVGFAAAPGTITNATYDPPVLAATRFYRRRVTSGVCPATFSNEIQITVNPLPTAPNPTGGGAVCSGNPAPDIVWTGLTGSLPFQSITYTQTPGGPVTVLGHNSTTFTITAPMPGVNTTYQITAIRDANGCDALPGTMGGTASVTIGGTAPAFDSGPTLSPINICDDGGATGDPQLLFSLDDAGSSNQVGFILTYKVDGSANRTKMFNTTVGTADPTAPVTFNDAEFNSVLPSPHVLRIVSILSPAGCQTVFNTDLNFTVNPRPPTATNPVNNVACIGGGGSPISVADPALITPNTVIEWSTGGPALGSFANAVPGSGVAGGTNNNTFTPTSSATATFYAFTRNTLTNCFSTTGIAVQHTEDQQPAPAAAGPNQPGLCSGTATMASTAATNGGSGAWTVQGQMAYQQNFENNTVFPIGTTTSAAGNGWTIDTSAPNAFPQQGGGGYFEVRGAGKRFEANNTNGGLGGGVGNIGELVWTSSLIDVSSLTTIDASVDLINGSPGQNEAVEDYIRVLYKLNGGGEIQFPTNGFRDGDFANTTASVTGLAGGGTFQIVIRVSNTAGSEIIAFDNIRVRQGGSAVSFDDPNATNAVVSNLPQNPPGGAPIAYTARWTVASALGACPSSFADVVLTVNPLPTSLDPMPHLCEDVAGGGSHANVDLTTYNAAVTNAPTVAWYSNPARTAPFLISAPVLVNNAGSKIFYFTATGAGPGFCTNIGQLTFTVDALPAKANQVVQICEDAPPGSLVASGINLQNFELVAAGGSLVNRDVEWYEDAALTILIPPGAAVGAEQNYSFNADKTIHAKIIDTSSPVVPPCFSQATLDLDYQARPNDNQITDGIGQVLGATYTVCASSNLVLLQINPGLNPGSTYTWTVPPVSYPGEFELLTGTTGFFIILRFPNPIPTGGSLYPTGLPISVKETLGTALCDGNTINTRIIVEGSPPKPIIAGPTSVCSGANGLVYSVTNPVAGSYSWTLPPGATITSLPVTASSITVQMSTFSGNVNVTHASGTGCTSPAADPYPVTVVARPTITSANTNSLCSGANVGAVHTLTSTIVGTTYNWQVINISGFVGGSLLGDFANGVVSINQTLTNTSGVTASVTYQVTPVGPAPDNCLGNPQNLTITVNPEPVIVAGQNKTICSGAPANFKILLTPAALPATTQFSWPAPMMSDLSVQGTAGAGVPQGDAIHIFDSFVNTSAAPITATYTISPVSGSACPGVDETVVITINPAPVGVDITRAAQCSNTAFSVSADNITNGVPGSTFTWVRNALPAGLTQVTGGTGTGPIAETLRNLTGGQLSATYVVTPTSGAGCPGATYVVTVPINPEPVGSAITRAAQCSDVAFSVSADNITNGVAGTTFTWTRNSLPAGLTQVVAGTGVGPIAETLRNQTSGQLSATYVVTPTSGAGCLGATYVVTVPINPEPLGAAITRAQQCSNVAFSVSADNITNGVAGVTFTWVRNPLPAGLTQVVAGTGSGAIAETLENLTGGQLNATYVVTPTSGAGCIGATYVVTVPVNPEPVGAAITRAAQCSNVAFSVSADNITNGVTGNTFTWVRNPLPAGLTQVVAGTGSGAIAETLQNLTGGQLSATYVVTPTSGAGCIGATYVVTVPVNPEPVGTAITRAAQCSNVAFSVSADNITNGVVGVTFTWVRNPLPVGLSPVSAGTGVGPIAETLRNTTGGQLSATYVVTPTSGAGCIGATYVVTVPIDPEPVGAAVTRAVQCSNVAFSVSADNITNGVAGSTFTWVRNALPPGITVITAGTGVGAIAETLGNITAGQLSATYTVTPTSGAGCLGADYVVTVPINPEPVGADITRAAQCSNVAFSVSADNITNGVSGVTFTWVRNALPAGLTQVVAGTGSGAIAETLRNLTGGQLSASYVVTPTSGSTCVGATYVVTVPINPEPVGAAITRAAQCSNVAFSLSADNITNGVAGVTFTWVRNPLPAGLTPVTAGSGIGPIAETLRNLTGAQLSATYVVTPTSGAGCVGATYVVTVPVDPEPVGAAITRAAQCSEVAFSVSADNITNGVVGSTFTWVRNALPAGLTQVVAGTGVGPIAETLRNLTGGQLSATYIVTPTSGAGCLGATYVVTVPVNPEPVGADVTRAAQCSNVGFSVSADNVTNGVAGVSFTWVRNALPPGLNQVVAGSGVGAIAETLSNITSSQLSATYTVTPTSGAGCIGATYVVTVPINPEPVGVDITRAAQCSNVAFSLSADNVTNGVAGSTFTWVRNALPAGLTQVVAGTGVGAIAETLQNLTAGQLSATYTVTPTSGVGCVGATYIVTVPVNPEPVGAAITRIAQCSNVAFSVSADNITNGVAGVTFTWVRNALPAGLTQVVAGTGVGAIAETLRNLTSGQLNATYTVTPTSGAGCTGATYVVTVPVNPEPVGTDVTRAAQCSNVAFSLSADNITNGVGGVTFTWVRNALPAGLTQVVAGTGSGAIAETLQNLTGGQLSATYTVTPTSGAGCLGATYVVTVPVNPEPIGAAITRAAQCSNAAFSVSADNITNGVVGSTFTWVRNVLPAGLTQVTAGTGSGAIAETLRNQTGGQLSATYVVTPTSGAGCTGATYVVTVPVNPEPVAQASSTIERCSGDPIAFDIQDIINNVAPFAGGNSVTSKFSYTVVANFPLEVSPAVFPGVFDRVVATNAPIGETFSNLSYRDVTLTYTITPISDPQNCTGTPFTLNVIIHPEPVGSNVVDPVCSTSLNHNIQSQITNPVPGLPSVFTYTFTPDPGNPTVVPLAPAVPPYDRTVASNANITDQFSNTTGSPATVTYTITPFNAANPTCAGTPFTYQVIISPNPTGVSDTKAAKCSDVAFIEDPQNNIVPAVASTFTWTATYDFGLSGGVTSGTGVISENLHNETAGQLSAHYTVIPTAGTCVGAAFFIDIPIDPEPVMLPALSSPVPVCSSNAVSGGAIGVILDTNGVSVAADSYTITSVTVNPMLTPVVGPAATGVPFPANSPAAGQSDAIALDSYRNTTSAQLNVVYTVRPTSVDGCQGDPFNITVAINPEPVLATPVWPDVCSSNTGVTNPVNVVLGTNGTSAAASSYQLIDRTYSDGGPFSTTLPTGFTAPGVVVVGTSGSINLVKNDKYTNVSTVPVTVRYTIQATSSQGCLSELLDYDVVINPEPVLLVPVPAPVCSDVTTSITLQEVVGSAVASTFNINNIIRQPGLVAGGSNASIGLGQSNLAIFNDTFTNTTAGNLTVTYKIAPVTAAGCVGAQKDLVLTIQPSPAVSSLNKTVCSNEATGITLSATVTSAPVAVPNGFNILGVNIQGGLTQTAGNTGVRMAVTAAEIQNDQFTNPGNIPLTVTYTIQGITSAGCVGPTSDVILTVEPTIIAVPVNNNANICSATQTDIDLTSPTLPTSGTITFNYTAVSSIGGQMTGFLPALNNLPLNYKITDNLVNNSNSTATVTYTITPVANGAKSGSGCSGAPVVVVVNVEPKPKLTASPLLQTVCESDGVNVSPTNILLTSTTMPTVGTLEFNVISATPTGGMTLQPATSPLKTTYTNGQLIVDQWNNPTLTDQTVTYTLRPQVNGGLGCPGDDVIVTITVKPRPIISPVAAQTVCSGEYRSINLTTDIPGTFATWSVVDNPNVTGELNGGGGSLDITLFNTSFTAQTVTYTVTPKFNNCDGIPIDIVVTVNPTPNTTGLPATITVCDGATLNVPITSDVAGTTFDWVVTDVFNLEAPGFFDGSGTTINQVINNPNGFQAVLIYQVTPTSPGGCVGLPRIMNVNVGSIVANVTPDQTSICSGGRIQMTNSSLGATSHRWFYRVQGTTTEIDVRTTPFVNYPLTNTTTTNPLVYEIVYQPSNGLCSIPDVVTPITVYRNVVAGLDEGTVPPIVGGTSTVNFTNTSTPVDGTQFRYEWDFGSSMFANPPTFTGANPPPVVYSQQGPYQVTLKATNIAAETAGLQCDNMFFKTIVVPVLPLVADFTLDPPAGCFPTIVRVVDNQSTGDVNEWKVVNSNGQVVAVSGEDLPEFFIATPGVFNVQLTTRDSFTDQVEFANQDFEIYSNPVASFQARPTTVFIPDTELTTFNFTTNANTYSWDFGDGNTSDEREPKHTYKIEGVYDIVLVAGFDHDNGVVCTDTLTQQVIAKQGGQTKVPNAFTPNPAGPSGGLNGGGQGGAGSFNDVFLPIVKGVEEFNMQIFDRWGNLIFESNNANQGWDGYDRNGNILPSGVYIYKLTLRLSDGQRTTQIGDITMIR